jgi:hypothetical protein
MRPNELQLNRIAQGLVPEELGLRWFGGLAAAERVAVLQDLAYITHQSHPKLEEVPLAIVRSGLKPTFTPCVMLQNADRPTSALSRIASLPEPEHAKSFRLLLALFSIADARRRDTQCKDGCTHEWHNLGAL